jgi:hypothetical protein
MLLRAFLCLLVDHEAHLPWPHRKSFPILEMNLPMTLNAHSAGTNETYETTCSFHGRHVIPDIETFGSTARYRSS